MGVFGIFLSAIESLRGNGLRSLLMALGVIIGTATIVIVVAVGVGAREAIDAQYSNMSVTTIFVNTGAAGSSRLSADDAEALKTISTVAVVAPQLTGRLAIANGETSSQTMVVGTTADYEQLAALTFASGAFFTQSDVDRRERVVVLGPTAAEELFGKGVDPVGESVRIAGRTLTVVGVTQVKGGAIGPITLDDSVFVPNTTAERALLGDQGKVSLNVQAESIDSVAPAMDDIVTVLREEHGLRSDQPDDFTVKDMGSKLVSAQDSNRTMTLLLSAVAVIVLVVGGIGIMNIMYVSVTERTREIGVRRAIGATRVSVLTQFLLEAVVLSVVGGLIGVVLGFAALPALRAADIAATASATGVALAFGFSLLTGIVFGFAPARRAARLDPIEALRHE
ncbi:MAG: multidrug ABC transporter substrate-binding protein [Actinobacteria bacterium HGW-Actinobacteria-1]|nr:MAG: multidrug ABC transporter substrate-binding protein [Actinobacteria bacterium HGW-Actinobacteria-1]